MSQSVFCQVRRLDILCSVDAVFLLTVKKEELRCPAVVVVFVVGSFVCRSYCFLIRETCVLDQELRITVTRGSDGDVSTVTARTAEYRFSLLKRVYSCHIVSLNRAFLKQPPCRSNCHEISCLLWSPKCCYRVNTAFCCPLLSQ